MLTFRCLQTSSRSGFIIKAEPIIKNAENLKDLKSQFVSPHLWEFTELLEKPKAIDTATVMHYLALGLNIAIRDNKVSIDNILNINENEFYMYLFDYSLAIEGILYLLNKSSSVNIYSSSAKNEFIATNLGTMLYSDIMQGGRMPKVSIWRELLEIILVSG